MPFRQGPKLQMIKGDDIKVLHQSKTIARYLARQFGVSGDTEHEKLQVDMVVDTI